jgi:hypothetical protein
VLEVALDGVCADFYGGLRPIAAEWLSVEEGDLSTDVAYGLPQWGISEKGARAYEKLHRYAVTQRDGTVARSCRDESRDGPTSVAPVGGDSGFGAVPRRWPSGPVPRARRPPAGWGIRPYSMAPVVVVVVEVPT